MGRNACAAKAAHAFFVLQRDTVTNLRVFRETESACVVNDTPYAAAYKRPSENRKTVFSDGLSSCGAAVIPCRR
ncbi:hypothetical protein [Kingella potus]|uniref:hypothetical protein n=1 Tax=Kingella potus TaxID=265175 RepID=UPI001FD10464|nr:hypothetical protein [Kingella potus]UOP00304.1 hypothetical protein LVJ84_10395 [Kingella potus]